MEVRIQARRDSLGMPLPMCVLLDLGSSAFHIFIFFSYVIWIAMYFSVAFRLRLSFLPSIIVHHGKSDTATFDGVKFLM